MKEHLLPLLLLESHYFQVEAPVSHYYLVQSLEEEELAWHCHYIIKISNCPHKMNNRILEKQDVFLGNV